MESNQDKAPKARRRTDRDRVVIFDTTLRDGEQCPGATMTFDEKLEVAEVLDEMGVDIIEAGFPIASEGDFNSVQEIARRAKKAVICGLARAQFKDIDRCAEAIKPAARGRIHTFIGTSPLHRKYQMGIDEKEVLERVTASVTRARSYTDDVEWSAMDATRTEHDFLCRCVEAAIKADTLALGETVRGAAFQAVWNKGRQSWDAKGLTTYAEANPEILQFRKEGEPSVTLRRVSAKGAD